MSAIWPIKQGSGVPHTEKYVGRVWVITVNGLAATHLPTPRTEMCEEPGIVLTTELVFSPIGMKPATVTSVPVSIGKAVEV
jgi:hypothetical protein